MDVLTEIPDQIKAPSGAQLSLRVRAVGVQVYVCQAGATGKLAWILKAPEADLYDHEGHLVGCHYGGPTWKYQDGSEISARVAARVDSPNAGAIPWLLLTVTHHSGSGVMDRVISIQRIHTVGGQPPEIAGCDKSDAGREVKIPYEAEYYFYTGIQTNLD